MRFCTLNTFLFWLALVISSTVAHGQKKAAIKLNLVSPVARTFNIAAEYAFHPRFSAQVLYFKTQQFTFRNSVFTGSGFTPEARVHLGKDYLAGLYAAPFVRFRKLTWEIPSKDASADFTSVSGGFCLGYEAVFWKILVLDIFVGPAFSSSKVKVNQGVIEDFKLATLTSGGVRSGLALGIALF